MNRISKALAVIVLVVSVYFVVPQINEVRAEVVCNPDLITKTLRYKQSGAQVRALQNCLVSKGYLRNSKIDGKYGKQTRTAVIEFYLSEVGISNWHGLSFGPKALKALYTNIQIFNPVSKVTSLKRITSEAEFHKYLDEPSYGYNYSVFRGQALAIGREVAVNALPSATSDKATSTAGALVPGRVSETNTQIVGVDEPDIVKTDGNTIYYSREGNMYFNAQARFAPCVVSEGVSVPCGPSGNAGSGTTAVNAFPLSSLGIASSSIPERGEMLLVKKSNTLIIFAGSSIVAYDVTDPAKPSKKWTNSFDGNTRVVASRLIDGTVYLVTSTYAHRDNSCNIVPMYRGTRENGTPVTVRCTDVWVPRVLESSNTLFTAMTISPSSGSVLKSVSYLGDSNNTTVMMSTDNLYIASRMQSAGQSVMLDFYKNEISDLVSQAVLSRIQTIAGYDISYSSKMSEISSALEKYSATLEGASLTFQTEINNRMTAYTTKRQRDIDRSSIVRIGLSSLNIEATASVPGHVLNQYALDEYQGNLRVAVTVGETWGTSGSVNDVYVLDKSLKMLGSVVDLGITERIYSARFVGDTAYLVTFRQTDPFYVIDLSVPTKPRKAGELKIPGYSAYLEPLSDNMILGVGREENKVKLSLFDVTNPANPIERSKYFLDEYWTEVENNHHAFLNDKEHRVVFIPGSRGGYVISYNNDTLSLKTSVAVDNVKRALYIDDYMYVIAENLITVLDENSWKNVAELKLDR